MKLNSRDLLGYYSDIRRLEELVRSLGSRVKEKICVLGLPRETDQWESFQGIGKRYWRFVNLKSEGMADMQEARVRAAVKVQRQCAGWQLCLALGGNQSLFYEGLQLIWKGPPTLWRVICQMLGHHGPASWHIKLIIKIYLKGAEK